MNITGLKIPTGGRHTSWLYTSMTEELNYRPLRNNSSLVVRAGLEPVTSGFQVRRPNHSATLPQVLRSNVEIVWPELELVGQQCWDMLRWDAAIVWPGLRTIMPIQKFVSPSKEEVSDQPNQVKWSWMRVTLCRVISELPFDCTITWTIHLKM